MCRCHAHRGPRRCRHHCECKERRGWRVSLESEFEPCSMLASIEQHAVQQASMPSMNPLQWSSKPTPAHAQRPAPLWCWHRRPGPLHVGGGQGVAMLLAMPFHQRCHEPERHDRHVMCIHVTWRHATHNAAACHQMHAQHLPVDSSNHGASAASCTCGAASHAHHRVAGLVVGNALPCK